MSVFVRYTVGERQTYLELQGDPFEVCDTVQRKLFPVLSEAGWQRFQARQAADAQRAREAAQ